MKVEASNSTPLIQPSDRNRALHDAAEKMEANFLAEMLKPMGAATASESFGGGIGEEQFSSFLIEAEAKSMVKAGGIGLAERIFHSLAAGPNADGK